jgi:DNA-binding NarL/FixJ family response regulator
MTKAKKLAHKREKHRLFLVDDHPVTREGLARLVNQQPDLTVCGEAGTASKAVQEIEKSKPDLVVIDVSLTKGPSGLELIKDLAVRHARLPVLTFSTHDELLYAERALRAGARGYVMKQEPTDRIMQAIRTVLDGKIYLSKAMNDRLLHKLIKPHSAPVNSDIEKLSDRELEVFRLLGQGLGTRGIAKELHLSVSTVESHRARIKEKLHLDSAPALVRHAVEWVHSQAS